MCFRPLQVVSRDELARAADNVLSRALKLPDVGRQLTKDRLHGTFSQSWEAQASEEAKSGWAMLTSDATVTALGTVLKKLQSGKPQPKL